MFGKTDWNTYLHTIRSKEAGIVRAFLGDKTFAQGLEIGAGDGYQTTLLAPICRRFISSDLNFERLKKQYQVDGVEYKKLDADNLKGTFSDNTFDFIFSSNVLEHLSNRSSFLEETHRVLTDDSYAVHVVPGRGLKLSYLFLFYPHLVTLVVDRILGLFKGKKLLRGKGIDLENNINTKKTTSWFQKIFLPSIHGSYRSHKEEYVSWSKNQWTNLFGTHGFSVVQHIKGPVFSGYGFGASFLRKMLAYVGFYSEHIFILKKKQSFLIGSPGVFRIAIIPPIVHADYLVTDIIDGILDLKSAGVAIECRFLKGYPHHFGKEGTDCELEQDDFVKYAQNAHIVVLGYRYKELNMKIADSIDRWQKTVFVDGSEPKHNKRFEAVVQYKNIKGEYVEHGCVHTDMLTKCTMYLRREKPYVSGIVPFPFGIQRRYRHYTPEVKKDIDFVCIFGQDTYPELRRYVKQTLEEFCLKHGFSCVTSHTKGFGYDDQKTAGRDNFYATLARAKVGISIGGGGFDTLRFWETLANNCLLITERIDIYNPDSKKILYDRIFQCNNLYDFQFYFEKIGDFLRGQYKQSTLETEYVTILSEHSTRQRVVDMLLELKRREVIDELPSGVVTGHN
jgi:ubiquinone/menaquinone biosynthesis C-methylase UbiE/uncharacterized protein YozE (UPF0346 family)